MAFLETPRFPDEIAFWCDGGPNFMTQISEALSGFEQRNQIWTQPRSKYDISSALRTSAEYLDASYSVNLVRDFFYATKGRLHGFRLKDFTDYKDDGGGTLGTGNGSTTAFQMSKLYVKGALNTTRQIKKPVSSPAPSIFINSVLKTAGSDYSIDFTTGIVTFTSPPGNGLGITWTGQFDVPVRFDTDSLMMRMEGGLYTIQNLNCIELRL
jgi:uncharacterized protein (TIGR02217 family)